VKVMVIGKGGREHALAWKIAQSPKVEKVFCVPGNAGTAADAENVDLPVGGDADPEFEQLINFAQREQIALTVVGPEAPLVDGIADAFRSAGLRIFGPTREAARLEGSKVFAKQLMRTAGVPTADFQVFDSAEAAERYLKEREPGPVVVKADGLAAGKGAIVCADRDEALLAVETIMRKRAFGAAGDKVVIEEKLDGEELSILAITDGRTIVTLEPSQDHKPAYDGDRGPNTGGMGAYSPTPCLTPDLMRQIAEQILVPTIHEMNRRGTPFCGTLYAGLMLTNQGPKVLEFNVRFGDPEAQPILMRLRSDLVPVLEATIDGRLDQIEPLQWDQRPAVCVVIAAEGYPGSYEKGMPISGLDEAAKVPDVKVFHAGTKLVDGQVVADGGRVLGVTAIGDSIADAKRRAYEVVRMVRFRGAWCRHDIADKALERLRPA